MEVSVLRHDNEVLFIEGGSDVVDSLLHVLRTPIGSLVAESSDTPSGSEFEDSNGSTVLTTNHTSGGPGLGSGLLSSLMMDNDKIDNTTINSGNTTTNSPLKNLQNTVSALRSPVFLGVDGSPNITQNGGIQGAEKGKREAVPKPFDWKLAVGEDSGAPKTAVKMGVKGVCGPNRSCKNKGDTEDGGKKFVVRNTNSVNSWYGVGFSDKDGAALSEFQISIDNIPQPRSINYMLGILSHDQLQKDLNNNNINNQRGCFIYPMGGFTIYSTQYGNPAINGIQNDGTCCSETTSLKMRFTMESGKLEFSANNGTWHDYTPPNLPKNTAFHPVILLYGSDYGGFNVTLHSSGCQLLSKPRPCMHPLCKFLISNNLEIHESSSLQALNILRDYQNRFQNKNTQTKSEKASSTNSISNTVSNSNSNSNNFIVTSSKITSQVLRKIVMRALVGKNDVLQYAFGQSSGADINIDDSTSTVESMDLNLCWERDL